MKRVVFLTGGGSAGHVTPHLALLPHLKALGVDIHYVGQAVSLSGQTDSPSYDGQTDGAAYGGQTNSPSYGGQTNSPSYGGQTDGAAYGGQTNSPSYGGQTDGAAYGGQTNSPSYVIEWTLIAPTGLPYHGIDAGKFRRYFDLQNLTDLFRIAHGFWQSLRLVRRLRPTLLFSKGGFVTPPLVWATWLVGHLPPFLRGGWAGRIPIVIHESDMTPGLANRLCLPFADRVCYSFPETAEHLPPDKAVYTGIPIRESLLAGDPVTGRRLCGFPTTGRPIRQAQGRPVRQAQGRPIRQAQGRRPCVLIMGGSQGAAAINRAVYAALDELLALFNVCHICGTGTGEPVASVGRPRPTGERESPWHRSGDLAQRGGGETRSGDFAQRAEASPNGRGRYKAFSYVGDELAHLYAMADVVVARAGATTLFELLALRKPALLIPLSLGASRGDQIQNAASFARRGFSHVLAEADLTPTTLVQRLEQAYAEREAMVAAISSRTTQAAQPINGVEAVVRVIRDALRIEN